MVIRKGDHTSHLKTPVAQLIAVNVKLPRNQELALHVVRVDEIARAFEARPDETGVPEFVALDNGDKILVFPRTDKRYWLRVIGTQYIEQ